MSTLMIPSHELPTEALDVVPVPLAASATVGAAYDLALAFSEVRAARRERTLLVVASALAGVATLVVAAGLLLVR